MWNFFSEDCRASLWFKRGWTLQELIAPETVHVFDMAWDEFGSRTDLCEVIASTTSISKNVLRYPSRLPSYSVAQRMSWAADRETTREEDAAYSLLGIFQTHMALFYGERMGEFTRLQEEIIKRSTDDSILAWGLDTQPSNTMDIPEYVAKGSKRPWTICGLLAASPADFKNCGMVRYDVNPSSAYTMSNFGLEIQLSCASDGNRSVQNTGEQVADESEQGLTTHTSGIGLLRCAGSKGTELFGIHLSNFRDGNRCDRLLSPSEAATVLVNG